MLRKPGLKLWRPGQHETAQPSSAPDPPASAEEEEESEEESLDKLTTKYARQAQQETRRALHRARKQTGRQKSMETVRAEGLARPLDCANKGFQLLAQMGYEQGKGIGKDGAGRLEPVAIEIKSKRAGLGVDEGKKRRRQEEDRRADEEQASRVQREERNSLHYLQSRRHVFE